MEQRRSPMKHDPERSTTLRRFLPLAILGAVLIALILATSASAALYSVTDIGTLGGETSEATAVNIWGEVTGSAQTNIRIVPGGGLAPRAFRYRHGVLTDLGPTEEVGEPTYTSFGTAINSAGDVVGEAGTAGGGGAEMFKANGSPSRVPCYPYCSEGAVANGINDADEIVGGGGLTTVPWLTNREGKSIGIGEEKPNCLGFQLSGQAFAINNFGDVVGEGWTTRCGPFQAFLYSGGIERDLGTLGGKESTAKAISDVGLVVGYSEIAGVTSNCGFFGEPECRTPHHAFSYRNGTMADLGTLSESKESWALGVNDFGEIVGASGEAELFGRFHIYARSAHAFLYRNGTMIDLNTLIPANSGWTLTTANGINDFGEIVGTGLHNGIKRGFILKPRWLWF